MKFDKDIIDMCTQNVDFLPLVHNIGPRFCISKPLSLAGYRIVRSEEEDNTCSGFGIWFKKNTGCVFELEETESFFKITYAVDKETLANINEDDEDLKW